jgi:hypothetical protein
MSLGANCVVMLRGHIQGSPNRIQFHSIHQEYVDSASLLAVTYLIRIRNVHIIADLL